MTACDICLWVHSLQSGGILRADIKITKEVKMLIKQFYTFLLYANGNKRRYLVVAYEHVIKSVANVKNTFTGIATLH